MVASGPRQEARGGGGQQAVPRGCREVAGPLQTPGKVLGAKQPQPDPASRCGHAARLPAARGVPGRPRCLTALPENTGPQRFPAGTLPCISGKPAPGGSAARSVSLCLPVAPLPYLSCSLSMSPLTVPLSVSPSLSLSLPLPGSQAGHGRAAWGCSLLQLAPASSHADTSASPGVVPSSKPDAWSQGSLPSLSTLLAQATQVLSPPQLLVSTVRAAPRLCTGLPGGWGSLGQGQGQGQDPVRAGSISPALC